MARKKIGSRTTIWTALTGNFPSSSWFSSSSCPLFGQRPRRGRCPVEHRGLSFVRAFVRSFVRPPPSLGPLGLKSGHRDLKSCLSSPKSSLSSLKFKFSGLKPDLLGLKFGLPGLKSGLIHVLQDFVSIGAPYRRSRLI